MKSAILEFVKKRGGGVTCVELCNSIPNFCGEFDWCVGEGDNVVLWSGVSEEAVEAMRCLLKDREIVAVPTSILTYLCDGAALNIPLVKSVKTNYKKPHWLPVAFSLYSQLSNNMRKRIDRAREKREKAIGCSKSVVT